MNEEEIGMLISPGFNYAVNLECLKENASTIEEINKIRSRYYNEMKNILIDEMNEKKRKET